MAGVAGTNKNAGISGASMILRPGIQMLLHDAQAGQFDVVLADPIRGGREINKAEANVVRRIFREFAAGIGPRTITRTPSEEGVPSPGR